MTHHPRNPLLRLASVTGAVTLIGAMALGFAVPGLASDATNDQVSVHVIRHDAAKPAANDSTVVAITSGCDGTAKQIDTETVTKDEGGKVEKTRIVLCSSKGAKMSDLPARLGRAREAISSQTALSAEAKAKALAALDKEIANLNTDPGFSRQ